jgi:hypothetical protein
VEVLKMAVKVMVAPVIAKSTVQRLEPRKEAAPAEPRPRRRRSSVYDADGQEVFITLLCLKCHKMRPLSLFGLRKMADGAIRNQPWCRTCRSAAGTRGQPRGSAESVDSPVPAASPEPLPEGTGVTAAADPAGELRPKQGNLAAQVAAALAAGLGR